MRNISLPDEVYQLELRQSRRFYEEDNVERNFVYKNEHQIEPTARYNEKNSPIFFDSAMLQCFKVLSNVGIK